MIKNNKLESYCTNTHNQKFRPNRDKLAAENTVTIKDIIPPICTFKKTSQ